MTACGGAVKPLVQASSEVEGWALTSRPCLHPRESKVCESADEKLTDTAGPPSNVDADRTAAVAAMDVWARVAITGAPCAPVAP